MLIPLSKRSSMSEGGAMMGRRRRVQGKPYHEFQRENRIRPSVDPELMIRMLLVEYCYGISSERRLCQIEQHLAYRWFCKLDLD